MRKGRRIFFTGTGALIAVLTAIMVFGDQGIMTFYRTRRQLRQLENEIVRSRRAVDSLTLEIERLRNDTTYIERIARERFGMARRDEKMYKFIEEK